MTVEEWGVPTDVVYHFPCYDGYTAAWVARRWYLLNAAGFGIPELWPMNHGDPVPEFGADARVLVLDFSWRRGDLERLAGEVGALLVLDHHLSAERELGGLEFAVFDQERSGAGLAWEFFFGSEEVHPLVKYVEDRDLWRFQWKNTSLAVHANLSSRRFEFDEWDQAALELEADPGRFFAGGEAVMEYQERQHEYVAGLVHLAEIEEPTDRRHVHVFPAVNMGVVNLVSSSLHKVLEENPEFAIVAKWGVGPDGRCHWSLRAREGEDASKVAQRFGGGGHAGAAGFTTDEVPAVRPLESG